MFIRLFLLTCDSNFFIFDTVVKMTKVAEVEFLEHRMYSREELGTVCRTLSDSELDNANLNRVIELSWFDELLVCATLMFFFPGAVLWVPSVTVIALFYFQSWLGLFVVVAVWLLLMYIPASLGWRISGYDISAFVLFGVMISNRNKTIFWLLLRMGYSVYLNTLAQNVFNCFVESCRPCFNIILNCLYVLAFVVSHRSFL